MNADEDITRLETKFRKACVFVGVADTTQRAIFTLLEPLKSRDAVTALHYAHSLRVGLLAQKIGQILYHDMRPLLCGGALHDLGKCMVCSEVLGRTSDWSDADQAEIERHVIEGHKLLAGVMDFSAEIIVRHHTFQEHGYPSELPAFLHPYSATTQLLISEYSRLIAIADVYDALHRANSATEGKRLSSEEVHERMLALNSDRVGLVHALYVHEIFT